ncbi:hypothetical protein E4U36_000790 [Claviceps purpurea]|nr:hypothetical protein E4U36_000790 [Claviceps purpurea]
MYDQKKCSSAAVAEFEEDYTVEAAAPSLEKNTLSIGGSSRAMDAKITLMKAYIQRQSGFPASEELSRAYKIPAGLVDVWGGSQAGSVPVDTLRPSFSHRCLTLGSKSHEAAPSPRKPSDKAVDKVPEGVTFKGREGVRGAERLVPATSYVKSSEGSRVVYRQRLVIFLIKFDVWVVVRLNFNDGGTVSVREKSLKDHQIGRCSQPLISLPHIVPQVLRAVHIGGSRTLQSHVDSSNEGAWVRILAIIDHLESPLDLLKPPSSVISPVKGLDSCNLQGTAAWWR